jgi:thiosulfate dehydrogenase [quinone] large subunit
VVHSIIGMSNKVTHQEDVMTADTPARAPVIRTDASFIAEPVYEETTRHKAYRYLLAMTRLSLGWVFLWAFLDKTFGLGHETPSENAWIDGGSPTEGFLANAPTGPFEDFYKDMAGQAWADWLFMIGLAGIGVALILGVAIRIAAVSGALLLLMMYTAVLPPENNPFMDDHIIYALVLGVLALAGANKTLGLGKVWERIPLVERYGFLK